MDGEVLVPVLLFYSPESPRLIFYLFHCSGLSGNKSLFNFFNNHKMFFSPIMLVNKPKTQDGQTFAS